MREMLVKTADKELKEIKLKQPFSIKKAVSLLHNEFCKFITVSDLDENTCAQISKIFTADMDEVSSEEEADLEILVQDQK